VKEHYLTLGCIQEYTPLLGRVTIEFPHYFFSLIDRAANDAIIQIPHIGCEIGYNVLYKSL
jgi:hypothetical protein